MKISEYVLDGIGFDPIENYSNFPFSIIRPDQIYVFSNDIMINCEYVIDLVFDGEGDDKKMRIIAQITDKTTDRIECHGLVLANNVTKCDTFYSNKITLDLKRDSRITFISMKHLEPISMTSLELFADPEYPKITDITMYKIKTEV